MIDIQYPDADPEELGEYYIRHISAMTSEGLHSKAAIAAQLAWRDRAIDLMGVVSTRHPGRCGDCRFQDRNVDECVLHMGSGFLGRDDDYCSDFESKP